MESKSEVAAQAAPIWAEMTGTAEIFTPSGVVRIEDVEDEGP
ncbi:hypothetical protein [Streptomyces anthocyanicus]